MQQRKLGSQGLTVSAIGYGAMGLEGYYGSSDDAQAIRTIQCALDLGVTLIDTADAYGNGHNEALVAKAIKGRRDQAVISTKFGIVFDGTPATELPTGWGFSLQVNGRPAYALKCLDRSLKTLGVDVIDLWYAHYADPATPIEETVGAMAQAVQAGKVKYLGLSNITVAELRRASTIHPISAVQYEYSLFRREAELELLPALRELGVGLVAWSPLGTGFLAGATTIEPGDFRNNLPKYQGENRQRNIDRFAPLQGISQRLSITPAQLALAWLLHQGDDLVPIPGTRHAEHLTENIAAATVRLNKHDLSAINELVPIGAAVGTNLL